MSTKRIFYIIFFSVLVVGFFFVISAIIPEYGTPKTKPISLVQPFSYINQDGKRVTEKDVMGKVTAVNFFFTTCTSCRRSRGRDLPRARDAGVGPLRHDRQWHGIPARSLAAGP